MAKIFWFLKQKYYSFPQLIPKNLGRLSSFFIDKNRNIYNKHFNS